MTKEEMLEKLNGSAKDFFSLLCDMRGASPLNEKLVQLLVDLHQGKKGYSTSAQKVLHIFFSLTNDGNTCISLNPKSLLVKWKTKWDGLVLLASQDQEADNGFLAAEDFMPIIEAGCKELLKNVEAPLVVETLSKNGEKEPFLFTEKYLDAKKIIEACFKNDDKRCVFNGCALASRTIDECKKIFRPSSSLKPNLN